MARQRLGGRRSVPDRDCEAIEAGLVSAPGTRNAGFPVVGSQVQVARNDIRQNWQSSCASRSRQKSAPPPVPRASVRRLSRFSEPQLDLETQRISARATTRETDEERRRGPANRRRVEQAQGSSIQLAYIRSSAEAEGKTLQRNGRRELEPGHGFGRESGGGRK